MVYIATAARPLPTCARSEAWLCVAQSWLDRQSEGLITAKKLKGQELQFLQPEFQSWLCSPLLLQCVKATTLAGV